MEKTISAADVNRKFPRLLRGAEHGGSYIVTSQRRVVAKVSPISKAEKLAASARDLLLKRLRHQPVVKISRWVREELYENGQ